MGGRRGWSGPEGGRRRVGPPRSEDPEPIGVVLEGIRGERRLASGMTLGQLGRRWKEVVGDRLAVETRPAGLDLGVLVVEASSAAWAAQVRFLTDEIRARANSLVGTEAVLEVRATVDGGPRER